MQTQLDAGLQLCEPCARFGWHTFCGECGQRYVGREFRWRECPGCKARVATEFCSLCGTVVAGEFLRRLEKGSVDWRQEARAASKAAAHFYARFPILAAELREHQAGPIDPVRAMTEVFRG